MCTVCVCGRVLGRVCELLEVSGRVLGRVCVNCWRSEVEYDCAELKVQTVSELGEHFYFSYNKI